MCVYSETGYCSYARMVYHVYLIGRFSIAAFLLLLTSHPTTKKQTTTKTHTKNIYNNNSNNAKHNLKKSNHLDVNIFRSIFFYYKTLLQTDWKKGLKFQWLAIKKYVSRKILHSWSYWSPNEIHTHNQIVQRVSHLFELLAIWKRERKSS